MVEYFDLYTEDGRVIGEKKLRQDVHRDGDWHRVVHVWIGNSRGEFLIQRRAAGKDTFPNKWTVSCAGHVSPGEKSLATAVRELNEELGVSALEGDLFFGFNCNVQLRDELMGVIDNEITDVYFLKTDFDDFVLQEEEVSDVKWVSFSKLEKLIGGGNFVPYGDGYFDSVFKEMSSLGVF